MKEEWREVVGGRYAVSSLGRVKQLRTRVGNQKERPLSLRARPDRYVSVKMVIGTRRKEELAHRLVAQAFLGPCPEGKEVNHKDGDKSNNVPQNLEYVTRGDNIRHAYQTGLRPRPRGEVNPRALLTDDLVRACRLRHQNGARSIDLAREFGIKGTTMNMMLTNQTWKHVKQTTKTQGAKLCQL